MWVELKTKGQTYYMYTVVLGIAFHCKTWIFFLVPGKPEQTNTTGASDRVVLPPENEPNPRGPPAPENNSQSSKGRPWQRRWSDTIELKRLPREHNNISKLNEYFQRFGNIINIQVLVRNRFSSQHILGLNPEWKFGHISDQRRKCQRVAVN